jgi:hypothetical protein
MLFTEDQIAFIDIMITNRLLGDKVKLQAAKPSNYHSIPEIRLLISANIERLKKDINVEEFDLNILRFFLKKYIDLRSLDEEYLENAGCTRFDNQVSNAVRADGWPNGACPIKPSGKIRKYQFVDFVSQSTLELQ